MARSYFAPLVNMPTIITTPGIYLTRAGETVVIEGVSTKHDFGCFGEYVCGGIGEKWHKSGRLFATHETPNDIVEKA